MEHRRTTAAGHLIAALTVMVWGTTFISTKILLIDFTPIEILFFRFVLGYAALAAAHPRRLRTKGWREERLFIGAGLCGVTLYFLLENIALTYSLASNVGIIVSMAPFFTAVLSHFLLKDEPFRTQFFVGFVIAFSGILLIGLNGRLVLRLNPAGDILALLAGLAWAAYSILMRKISRLAYSTVACTRRVFFYGLLLMAPALFLMDFKLGLERFAAPRNLFNLLFLGLLASAICFATWNWAVGVLGAVKTSLYIYIVPVVTIAAAALILHETITGLALLGAFLALFGLYLSQRKGKPSAAREKTPLPSEQEAPVS